MMSPISSGLAFDTLHCIVERQICLHICSMCFEIHCALRSTVSHKLTVLRLLRDRDATPCVANSMEQASQYTLAWPPSLM